MRTRIAVILPVVFSIVLARCGGQDLPVGPTASKPAPCPLATRDELIHTPVTVLSSVVALSASEVWSVGYYSDGSNSVEHTLANHWNGEAWSAVTPPNTDCGVSNELRSVAASAANNVWAVGAVTESDRYTPLTEHWNGSSWTIVPTPTVPGRDGQLEAVTVTHSNDAWAVGWYATGDGISAAGQTLIEHWDGRAWSIVASPHQAGVESELHAVAASNSHDVWAGGLWGPVPLLLHWDGVSWSSVAGALPPAQLFGRWIGARVLGLSARGPRDVWAVGSYQWDSPSGEPHTLAEQWDGSNWSLTPVDPIVARADWFEAVASFSATDAWAVGRLSNIKHWDGSRWTKVAAAPAGVLLNSVAGTGSADVWAVGFDSMIEHWNGSSWATVGSPPPAWPTATPQS